MIDVKLIRENLEFVRKNLKRRDDEEKLVLLDSFVEVDKQWRFLQTKLNELRRELNILSAEIARLRKQGSDNRSLLPKAALVQAKIKKLSVEVSEKKQKSKYLIMQIPNIIHDTVPFGRDEKDNVEIRRWGTPPRFSFEPKNHVEIALNLGLLEEERANKVSGSGFYYLKGRLVLLDLAIQRLAVDFLLDLGYTLIEPPYMLRRAPYEGATDLSDFESVMYKIEGEDHYLIATSEHPIAAMFMNETLNMNDLPLKFIGISTNFRKEIGTHGKYTKGFFRMHQFNKVEQFIFCLPEQSNDLHEELQQNSETLYKMLDLHHRVVNVCTGDIGTVAAKKYDTEVWITDGSFREVGSNSNCTSYQSRRLGIRYRVGLGKPPKDFVHTLNSTALATSRTMMGILEQHQLEDGSVVIPKPLRPYMRGVSLLKPTKKSE